MTIVCGTDFSKPAGLALLAAARLAQRFDEELVLVNVLDIPGANEVLAQAPSEPPSRIRRFIDEECRERRAELDRALAVLRELSARVRTEVLTGAPDEALVAFAEKVHAGLLVVASLGRRAAHAWRLGSTADRVAQTSKSPVLVVRTPEAFAAWTRGERPLNVVAGIDASPTSDATLRWLAKVQSQAPCRIVGVHVYWPPEQYERLEIRGGLPIGTNHPEVERALKRTFEERLALLHDVGAIELRMIGGLGRPADHLVQIAADENADLIAIGTHQRMGIARAWHGSVSHGVIDLATTNVVCVPSTPK